MKDVLVNFLVECGYQNMIQIFTLSRALPIYKTYITYIIGKL